MYIFWLGSVIFLYCQSFTISTVLFPAQGRELGIHPIVDWMCPSPKFIYWIPNLHSMELEVGDLGR